ncbi:MAG TPA: Ig-like domain-containing protein [Acidimicrobiales bacterium]|nr:Ig-like domain-containing protein [Acidimicrobiales bacterium]
MQALRERSTHHRRRWLSPWLVVAVVVVVAAAGVAYVAAQGSKAPLACAGASCSTGTGGSGGSGSGSGGRGGSSSTTPRTFTIASTTPAPDATGIASNARLTVTFNSPVGHGGQTPTLSPSVPGAWHTASKDELVFTPSAPFVPYTKYTLTVPGGSGGLASAAGTHLDATRTVTFTIADGSVLRLQQLLSELGYLPVAYTGPAPPQRDLATPQQGTFTWRWPGLPAALTGQWAPGTEGAITKGAVMMFETENGIPVDGLAGPQVWSTLLHDFETHKANTQPVTYVLVTKVLPQHLTAWVNGTLKFRGILVNTGVPGANTVDGTFQVFEHVQFSDMKGTDVTGTTYTDPHVPWASYFNGGDALHGFPRTTYGWPQSNGCVEMRISTAGALWPYTPIGTVVTVQGPSTGTGSSQPAPPTTTTAPPTTTTAPPPTTTAPPAG